MPGNHHAVNGGVGIRTSQSKLKSCPAEVVHQFSSPRLGFKIHFQAVPVTMKDKRHGVQVDRRAILKARTFWSSKMASAHAQQPRSRPRTAR